MGSSSSSLPENIVVTKTESAAFDKAISNSTRLKDLASLYSSETISDTDLRSCFELVASTSADDYRKSSKGWSPNNKLAEMRDRTMRYLLLREQKGLANSEEQSGLAGFLSYMLTEEDEYLVIYIYELHMIPTCRGGGIGSSLVQVAEAIGAAMGMEKAMLTVFTTNDSARRLYERLGYVKWDEELVARRRLRSGTKESRPTYVILAKDLHRTGAV